MAFKLDSEKHLIRYKYNLLRINLMNNQDFSIRFGIDIIFTSQLISKVCPTNVFRLVVKENRVLLMVMLCKLSVDLEVRSKWIRVLHLVDISLITLLFAKNISAMKTSYGRTWFLQVQTHSFKNSLVRCQSSAMKNISLLS